MVASSIAINAYQTAMGNRAQSVNNTVAKSLKKPQAPVQGFDETLSKSLNTVNEMQAEKKLMIEEFASGKNLNVHELMITAKKAGLAMEMTGAVRSKVMQAYQEIMRMPF